MILGLDEENSSLKTVYNKAPEKAERKVKHSHGVRGWGKVSRHLLGFATCNADTEEHHHQVAEVSSGFFHCKEKC